MGAGVQGCRVLGCRVQWFMGAGMQGCRVLGARSGKVGVLTDS